MKRTRLFQISFSCMAMVAMLAGSMAQATANDSHAEKVMASFLKHVASLDNLGSDQKTDIEKTIQQLGQDSTGQEASGDMQIRDQIWFRVQYLAETWIHHGA